MTRVELAVKTFDGSRRVLPYNTSGSVGATPLQALVWDSKNRRHVTAELLRHKEATRLMLEDTQLYTMSGPDGTKVGTDFAVIASSIGDSKKRKVAIAPPQVCVFLLFTHLSRI